MIRSFRGVYTQQFCEGKFVPEFEPFRKPAEKRLRLLEAAASLQDLFQLQSAGLKFSDDDPPGRYSLLVHDWHRVVFDWPTGAAGPEKVMIG
jgi:toxin HigB-1